MALTCTMAALVGWLVQAGLLRSASEDLRALRAHVWVGLISRLLGGPLAISDLSSCTSRASASSVAAGGRRGSNSCCVGEPGAAARDRVVPGVESRELELTDEMEVAVLGSSLRIPMSGLLTCTL